MKVKWHGKISSERHLPGGSVQGASLGIWEYISQTTGNVDFLETDKRYFIDDLSVLEVLNLVSVGISSYNFHNHVASDIGINQLFIAPGNIQSQHYMNQISNWTKENQMQLNNKKTKIMIFNFTHNYQFTTRIFIQESLLDIIDEIKLLGVTVTSDLKHQHQHSSKKILCANADPQEALWV